MSRKKCKNVYISYKRKGKSSISVFNLNIAETTWDAPDEYLSIADQEKQKLKKAEAEKKKEKQK